VRRELRGVQTLGFYVQDSQSPLVESAHCLWRGEYACIGVEYEKEGMEQRQRKRVTMLKPDRPYGR